MGGVLESLGRRKPKGWGADELWSFFLGFFFVFFYFFVLFCEEGCWVNGLMGRTGSTRSKVDWVMGKIGQLFGPEVEI